ncbi:MAG: hypothetical protein J5937_04735, partial [Paludibacteraceae bacterium]|nr:hypothetical protein [Paludibacteraceae bacterium]
GFKEFYVRSANSRGARTPSNVHRTFSVRLNRFTAEYKEEPHSMRDKKRNQGGIRCRDNKQSKTTVKLRKLRETTGKNSFLFAYVRNYY